MRCLKCKKEMEFVRKDTTDNPMTKKKYLRDVYKCAKDDIWVTIETPE